MTSVSNERKLFDLGEANRTLPLVSRIVRDIVDANSRMREVHLEAQRMVDEGSMDTAEQLQDRLQEISFQRTEFIDELQELGIELKDPNVGLIDFPAMLEDRVVYLCWRLGEGKINHWHELESGFAGRQPVEGSGL